jgi:hypothetical protein
MTPVKGKFFLFSKSGTLPFEFQNHVQRLTANARDRLTPFELQSYFVVADMTGNEARFLTEDTSTDSLALFV